MYIFHSSKLVQISVTPPLSIPSICDHIRPNCCRAPPRDPPSDTWPSASSRDFNPDWDACKGPGFTFWLWHKSQQISNIIFSRLISTSHKQLSQRSQFLPNLICQNTDVSSCRLSSPSKTGSRKPSPWPRRRDS